MLAAFRHGTLSANLEAACIGPLTYRVGEVGPGASRQRGGSFDRRAFGPGDRGVSLSRFPGLRPLGRSCVGVSVCGICGLELRGANHVEAKGTDVGVGRKDFQSRL